MATFFLKSTHKYLCHLFACCNMQALNLSQLTLIQLLINGSCISEHEHMCIMHVFNFASLVFFLAKFSLLPQEQSVIQSTTAPVAYLHSQAVALLKCLSYQPSLLSLWVSHDVRPITVHQISIPIRIASQKHSLLLL